MEKFPVTVSIVIPVYNVENYLDRCIESILNQSYHNLDIILVNDGSTDSSLVKCQNWEARDERIRLINQENHGLGPARGAGICAAEGEFIAFIDSDDWVHKDFIRELVSAAIENQADIVYCDVYKAFESVGHKNAYQFQKTKLPGICKKSFHISEYPEVITKCGNWTWNKLYKKTLWTDLGLIQPAQTVEDICTIFVLLAKASGIYHVEQALYYYYQRNDSLSYQDSFPSAYKNALQAAEQNINKYQIPYELCYQVGKVFGDCLSFTKLHFRGKDLNDELISMEAAFKNSLFFKDSIGSIQGFSLGSFNLRCVLKEVLYVLPPYFGFSSLTCMMHPPEKVCLEIKTDNHLRAQSIEYEIAGTLKKLLLHSSGKNDYVFLDFLEERYDLIEFPVGGYMTKSSAFDEAIGFLPSGCRIISNGSEEYKNLWQESCMEFIEMVRKRFGLYHIILVKHKLSETYRLNGCSYPFDDFQNIKRINQLIIEMEQFFASHMEGVPILELNDKTIYYTDGEYTHGCYPWHLNTGYYERAGKHLKGLLDNRM